MTSQISKIKVCENYQCTNKEKFEIFMVWWEKLSVQRKINDIFSTI